jgi:hypothetical protein
MWTDSEGRLRDTSKRGSSTARADAFAGANAKKKRRLASVGMTVLGGCGAVSGAADVEETADSELRSE